MREAFSNALIELARRDSRVILVTGDHGYALFDQLRSELPDQYINAGIAEQNMVGVAAGLARQGFRPFVYGLSAFIPIRVLEQIKIDVAHDNLPVVFLGDGAGFVYSHLGTSHQSTEDIAAVRAIPGIDIFSPGDRHELRAALFEAYRRAKPVYFRMGKADLGDAHPGPIEFPLGGSQRVVRGSDLARPIFVATGSMVTVASALANSDFLGTSVWSAIDLTNGPGSELEVALEAASAVVTLEEHSTLGGLGGMIAEWLTEHSPKRLLRIGVTQGFSKKCGTYQYLLDEHGLSTDQIRVKISDFASLLDQA